MYRILSKLLPAAFRDPTYIHLLFYLADARGTAELVEDYNEISSQIGTDRLISDRVKQSIRELLRSERTRYTVLCSADQFEVILHAYEDWQHPEAYVLQVVHALGKETRDLSAGWQVARTVRWDNMKNAIGSTRLFVVNARSHSPEICRRKLLPILKGTLPEFRAPCGLGNTDLGFGYLQDLGLGAYLLLLWDSNPMPQEAIDFQCVHLPRLEMHRHKARYYARMRDDSIKLINEALGSSLGATDAVKLLESEECYSLAEKSLDECDIMHKNVKDARKNYINNVDTFVRCEGSRRGDLWQNILRTFDPLVQDRHVADCRRRLEKARQELEQARTRNLSAEYDNLLTLAVGAFVDDEARVLAQIDIDDPGRAQRIRSMLYELYKGKYHRVKTVKRFSRGASGSEVFLIVPVKNDRECASTIAKIGPAGELEQERTKFEEIVRPRIQNYVGRVEIAAVDSRSSEWGGVIYTCAGPGMRPGSLKDFAEFVLTNTCEEVNNLIHRTFETLSLLHKPTRIWMVPALEYRIMMPSALRGIIQDDASVPPSLHLKDVCWTKLSGYTGQRMKLCGNILELDASKQKVKLWDPGTRIKVDLSSEIPLPESMKPEDEACFAVEIKECLWDRLRNRFKDASGNGALVDGNDPVQAADAWLASSEKLEMAFSPIHGDLNLGNIIIDERNEPWVIDWAKTRESGHTAFDFAKLETELKLHLLVPNLDGNDSDNSKLGQLINFEKNLPPPSSAKDLRVGDGIGAKIRCAVSTIRNLAINCDITDKEYFLSLGFYSLSTLKFARLSDLEVLFAWTASSFAFNNAKILSASHSRL